MTEEEKVGKIPRGHTFEVFVIIVTRAVNCVRFLYICRAQGLTPTT